MWPGATELEVVTGPGTGEALVSVTPRGRSAPRLPDIGTGMVVGGKVRHPPGAVHAAVDGRTYRISPGVFWQVHIGAATALLAAVLDLVGPCEGATVADLYAGAGLFSVPLAEAVGPTGSVLAVERDGRACADARHNGATFPNLRVLEGDVTPALVESALGRPDIVVLDPAREGAGTGVMRCPRPARIKRAPVDLRVVRPLVLGARSPRPAGRGLAPDGAACLRYLPHDRARGARGRVGAALRPHVGA